MMGYIFGNWIAVVIYSAFFISLTFSFAKPRGLWKKYDNIFTAWIVAFYIEMFGFPFTLFIIYSILGLDLLSAPDPRPLSLLMGSWPVQVISQSLVVAGVIMVTSGWIALYYAKGRVVYWGPYSIIRHPQYLGLILIATGLLVNFPTFPTLIMYPFLMMAYYRLSKIEEEELRNKRLYSLVGNLKDKPTFISLALIASYMMFVISVYFKGPLIYQDVGLYQVVSLILVLLLAYMYSIKLKKKSAMLSY